MDDSIERSRKWAVEKLAFREASHRAPCQLHVQRGYGRAESRLGQHIDRLFDITSSELRARTPRCLLECSPFNVCDERSSSLLLSLSFSLSLLKHNRPFLTNAIRHDRSLPLRDRASFNPASEREEKHCRRESGNDG